MAPIRVASPNGIPLSWGSTSRCKATQGPHMIPMPPPPPPLPPDRASPGRRMSLWWQLQRCLLPLRPATNRIQYWVQNIRKTPLALVLHYVLVGPTNTCGYYDASHYLSDSAYTRQKHDHDHCYCHDGNTNENIGTAFILRTRGSY